MKTVKNLFLLSLVLLLSSCSAAYLAGSVVGGNVKSFNGVYELPLKENIENSTLKIKETLGELKYRSISNTSLVFEKESNMIEQYGISSYNTGSIQIHFKSDKMIVNISQTGNYNFGTEEKTNETFAEIKKLYLSK